MLATLAAYSDDFLVMPAPSYPLPDTEEAKSFAIGFHIPVVTQGIRMINRPAMVAPGIASSRQQLYERYFAGDPVRGAGGLYHNYNKVPHIQRIHESLDRFDREAVAAGNKS